MLQVLEKSPINFYFGEIQKIFANLILIHILAGNQRKENKC